MTEPRQPTCPICRRIAAARPENASFPFCSGRCRQIDLARWLNEEYVLSRPIDPEKDADAIRDALEQPPSPERRRDHLV